MDTITVTLHSWGFVGTLNEKSLVVLPILVRPSVFLFIGAPTSFTRWYLKDNSFAIHKC